MASDCTNTEEMWCAHLITLWFGRKQHHFAFRLISRDLRDWQGGIWGGGGKQRSYALNLSTYIIMHTIKLQRGGKRQGVIIVICIVQGLWLLLMSFFVTKAEILQGGIWVCFLEHVGCFCTFPFFLQFHTGCRSLLWRVSAHMTLDIFSDLGRFLGGKTGCN